MLHWTEPWRIALMAVLAVLAVAAEFRLLRPIAQDPAYHRFADSRPALGMPNAGDVGSNVLFLAVGGYGLACVGRSVVGWGGMGRARSQLVESPTLQGRADAGSGTDGAGADGQPLAYAVFFAGVVLTGFGSAYYHWSPDNGRLVWDRLPMSVGFMGLLSATIGERVSARLGRALLGPLLAVGLGSVVLWAWTESRGRGDLRPYYGVQFLSLGLMLVMVVLFPSPRGGSAWVLTSLGVYAVAKACESHDRAILTAVGVSGHTLKHVVAAAGILLIAEMLAGRATPRTVAQPPVERVSGSC